MLAPSATGRCGIGLIVLPGLLMVMVKLGLDWLGWIDEAGVEVELEA